MEGFFWYCVGVALGPIAFLFESHFGDSDYSDSEDLFRCNRSIISLISYILIMGPILAFKWAFIVVVSPVFLVIFGYRNLVISVVKNIKKIKEKE